MLIAVLGYSSRLIPARGNSGSVAPDHRHPPLRQINTRACRLSYSRAWLSGRNTSPGHMPR